MESPKARQRGKLGANPDRCKPIAGGFTEVAQVIDSIRFISLYNFAEKSDNCCMNINNTDAQVKAQIISKINNLRTDAEFYGYDYPTDANLESESIENLREFLHELSIFVLDGIIAEIQLQQGHATH